MPRKKNTRTRTTIQEVEEATSPIGRYIRGYLMDGDDFHDELREYQYKIKVYKYNQENRPVLITGRVYDDLENLPMELGARFGTSRFRLFVTVNDEEKKVAFVKIEDFPLMYEGGEQPTERNDQDDDQDDPAQYQVDQLAILKSQQAHEKEMAQMKQQHELMMAAIQAKGGGGVKASEILDILRQGIALGSGRVDVDDAGAGGDEDSLTRVLNSPLAAAVATKLMEPNTTAAPGPTTTAPPQP